MADVLYGIKCAVLEEIDPSTQTPVTGGISCRVETAESAELKAVKSEGEENVQRTDNKILAIVRTPDLLYGYDVTFTDNTFDPTVGALIEGGSIRTSGGQTVGYDSPLIAEGASMKPFRMTIYIANYVGDSIKNYVKLTLNNCSGSAPDFNAAKEFYSPEFTIKAREATAAGLPIKSIDYVDSLPDVDTSILACSIGTLTDSSSTHTITAIPSATTVAALKAAVTVSVACAVVVKSSSGALKTSGAVVSTDTLTVYELTDSTNSTVYTLTVSN